VYGKQELDRALRKYTVSVLNRTAAVIERAHPDTKPTNRGNRAGLIAYLVAHS
jgi:hypothetical protein